MIVFLAPLLFKFPDFLKNFSYILITSLLHNITVHLRKRKRKGKMHQTCWSNTTIFYS